ncbi:unnamed protein product [Larinioides sclopetarius]|uniref:Inorganic phosphate cotransporter n=1 Tax=Larinioides sclopetarius TaxID=280406 RepID=A0AAV1ZEN9_9ARAC
MIAQDVQNFQGVTFPVITQLISNWSPRLERSRISSFINCGMPIGNIIGSTISGFLSSTNFIGGWPSIFYLFVYETPEEHTSISKDELLYIQQNKEEKPQTKAPIPWRKIFSSFPVRAVLAAQFGHCYGCLMFLTVMPTYFQNILHFDITTNGILSALPYAALAINMTLASFIADGLRKFNKLSITAIRKIANSLGLIGPAVCCLGIVAFSCQREMIVGLLCLALFLNGFAFSGFGVTHVDMSADFSGVIYGISNSVGSIAGMLTPMIASFFTASGGVKYNWDSKTQGIILSSFYYGYVTTQLPGGIFCDKFGATWLFGGGILVTSVLYLLIPLAASWGVLAITGVTFPAITQLISNWSPKFERSRISSFINCGIPIGNIIGSTISGFLSSTDFIGGWPSIFYLFGCFGCFWFFLWCILVFETPEDHPSISKDELLYIQQNKEEKPQTNGILSALPYAALAINMAIASFIADGLRKCNKLSITTIRKTANSLGLIGPAVCCLGIVVFSCQREMIVGLMCLALFLNGFAFSGFGVTHVDMSADFSAVTFGISNSVGNIAGILAPVVVSFLTASGDTVENWNIAFYITAAVYITCAVFYAFFASAEMQPWGLVKREAPGVLPTDRPDITESIKSS